MHLPLQDGEKMAVRWMPPETHLHNTFTVKSDIYSYGVLMWEVFTYGRSLPFNEFSKEEVLNFSIKQVRAIVKNLQLK